MAAACQPPEQDGVAGLIDELSAHADLIYLYDENERRASAAIYANENIKIRNSAFARSIGMRLAALMLELGRSPRYAVVRDRLDALSQQIDQLDQGGGKPSDVKTLRDSLVVLCDAAAAMAESTKSG